MDNMKDVDLPLLQSLIKAASICPDQKSRQTARLTPELAPLIKQTLALQTKLKQSEIRVRQLERQLDTDDLTGLHNRRGFIRLLTLALDASAQSGYQTEVIIADLDGFKGTNDQYGHAAGDAVLRHVARLIKKHLGENDFAGRLGGDEFAIALVKCNDSKAIAFIEQVKSCLGKSPVSWQHHHLVVMASFGRANSNDHASMTKLLHSADLEMYRHKHATQTIAANPASPT
jgi:diguanylate cyclase (GGDEF)-like protein